VRKTFWTMGRSFNSLLFLFLIGGCGYQLAGAPRSSTVIGGASGKVSVGVFDNATFEPLLERQTTDAIKHELLIEGWQIVNDSSLADLVVRGKVAGFELIPLSLDPFSNILEYRVRITVSLSVEDPKEKKTLWKATAWEATAEFVAANDATVQRTNEDRAIREASGRLALDLVHRLSTLPPSGKP